MLCAPPRCSGRTRQGRRYTAARHERPRHRDAEIVLSPRVSSTRAKKIDDHAVRPPSTALTALVASAIAMRRRDTVVCSAGSIRCAALVVKLVAPSHLRELQCDLDLPSALRAYYLLQHVVLQRQDAPGKQAAHPANRAAGRPNAGSWLSSRSSRYPPNLYRPRPLLTCAPSIRCTVDSSSMSSIRLEHAGDSASLCPVFRRNPWITRWDPSPPHESCHFESADRRDRPAGTIQRSCALRVLRKQNPAGFLLSVDC